MADDKTLNEDDELEIVEVEKLPTTEEIAQREAAAAEDKGAEGEDDDHEDEEDTRLAEREDEDGHKESATTRKKRQRAAQKAARDRTLAQVDTLTAQLAETQRLVAELQGHTVGITEREIGTKLVDAKRRLADFDSVLAAAVEAGDGAGYVAALSQRDAARDEARNLEATAERIEQARKNPPTPKADPRVAQLADQWRAANPWYDSRGRDEDSAIVNAIDNRLTAEGFKPDTMDYWQELTKRVARRIGTAETADRGAREDVKVAVRKGPAVGGDRSAGTPGSRKEVYVTPERKQAMQDAGIWDDPVKRSKMLKSYRDYDAQQTASR